MLYAITPQAREKAAAMGCNWALVHTLGHKAHRSLENPLPNDDLPLYLASEPKVAALRKAKRSAIEFEKRILCESVEHARSLGMKPMIHSYEVSLPPELQTVYPSLYRPMVKEYRNCSPETRANREPCLSDPAVRELISRKVAETVALVPDLDAYAFSFNECISLTKIRHRCERCRDIPFWQQIQWLAEAVTEGARSVNPGIRLFHRLWGLNEHDDIYHTNTVRQMEFSRGDYTKPWLEAHAKVYAPRSMHYKPSVDLVKYLNLQQGTGLGFIAKATWADVSIDLPLNPWVKALKGHDTIVELSFESTSLRPDGFHVLGNQFQRAARFARACGAAGVAGIPVDWGDKYNEMNPLRGFQDEAWWRLSLLNFDVVQAVMKNPDADMPAVIRSALRKRYGVALPAKLAEYVLESQDIKAGALNIRGIRATGRELEEMYYQILRYGPTVKNWKSLISRSPANLAVIMKEKDGVVARAEAILADIKTYEGRIPEKAFREFVSCFTDLRNTTVTACKRQKFNFLLWAMKEGTIRCDMKTIHTLEKCL
jgi:hypothetical protein